MPGLRLELGSAIVPVTGCFRKPMKSVSVRVGARFLAFSLKKGEKKEAIQFLHVIV